MPSSAGDSDELVPMPDWLIRKLHRPPAPRYGRDNLRQYLAESTLPTISRFDRTGPLSAFCVPLKGRRTHKNKLKIRHEAERRLAKIRLYDPKAFNTAVQKYHKKYVYGRKRRPFAGKHYAHREGEMLVIPSRGTFPEGSFEDIPYPVNINEMCRWVLERPLCTMQRAMHLAFPDTTRWWFDEAGVRTIPNRDAALWRTYLWRFHPDEHQTAWWRDAADGEDGIEEAPSETMVVAVQAPWILGPQDMQNVAECGGLPEFDEDGTPPETPLRAEQRVWGKLHDTCKAANCPNFVLTNYHNWLFGKFSEDWTTAWTTTVHDFDGRTPSVMQSLVYWVAASMDLTGTKWRPTTMRRPA